MNGTTQYLYKIQPTRAAMLSDGPTAAETDIVAQHFAYLQDLVKRGVVILAGRTLNTDPSSFGIVIFKASSAEQARAIVDADPAVVQGVMHAELYPYKIALLGQP